VAIDFTTDLGKVRLLLSDVDEGNLVFSDIEVQAFLDLEGGSVKRAAAQAIDTNATNEALASKVIKDHNLSTDGAKVADAMRKHAAALREQAADYDDEGFFEVVDFGCSTGWPVC
jgi:hypothetical protein